MSHQDDLQKELELWQRRLQKRRQQKATFGISADPSIDIEIEDIEARVKLLQADLLAHERMSAQPPPTRSQATSLPAIEVAQPTAKQIILRSKPRIFLCHASEDKPRVKELYHLLKDAGYRPWLDKFDLLPGQRWQPAIRKVVTNPSNLILVCLSQHSITKRGVVQQEIKWALDILEQMPEESIYMIPVRLEVCPAPEQLAEFHWVDLFEPDGFEYLTRALDFELRHRQASSEPLTTKSPRPINDEKSTNQQTDTPPTQPEKQESTALPKTLTSQPLFTPQLLSKKLLQLLRDPIWQMIGVIVAIVGVGWPIYTFYANGNAPDTPTATPTVAITTATDTPTNTPTSIPTPSINTPNPTQSVVLDDRDAQVIVNFTALRREPNLLADAVLIVHGGDIVEILARNREKTWVYVRGENNKGGWLSINKLNFDTSILDELSVEPTY